MSTSLDDTYVEAIKSDLHITVKFNATFSAALKRIHTA